MRATQWQASPRFVRVFLTGSVVLDRDALDAAKTQIEDPDTFGQTITVNGIELDEQDIADMRAAMTAAYQQQMQDWRAELSMGEM